MVIRNHCAQVNLLTRMLGSGDGSVWSEEETRLVDQAEQTSFTDFPDMVSYDRENGPTPTAPHAYTPVYPARQRRRDNGGLVDQTWWRIRRSLPTFELLCGIAIWRDKYCLVLRKLVYWYQIPCVRDN